VYTLDTNAILYYLKDDPDTVASLRNVFTQNVPLYVSAITELELFAFSNLSTAEEKLIEELLTTVAVISLDSHIARLSAFIRRQYRLKVPDSVIAATALFTGSTLLTRNTRDFRRIPNLSLLRV
jgi:predicted nucleic acid-binding protein